MRYFQAQSLWLHVKIARFQENHISEEMNLPAHLSHSVSPRFSAASIGNATVANTTTDAPLYATVRTGPTFAYYLNLLNGYYLVTLRFAEGQFTLPGQRVFSIDIQVGNIFREVSQVSPSSHFVLPLTSHLILS